MLEACTVNVHYTHWSCIPVVTEGFLDSGFGILKQSADVAATSQNDHAELCKVMFRSTNKPPMFLQGYKNLGSIHTWACTTCSSSIECYAMLHMCSSVGVPELMPDVRLIRPEICRGTILSTRLTQAVKYSTILEDIHDQGKPRQHSGLTGFFRRTTTSSTALHIWSIYSDSYNINTKEKIKV